MLGQGKQRTHMAKTKLRDKHAPASHQQPQRKRNGDGGGAMSIVDVMAAAVANVTPSTVPGAESRFPVVVSGETRAFLDALSESLGVSLAGLCGTILNEVVSESKRRSELCNPS